MFDLYETHILLIYTLYSLYFIPFDLSLLSSLPRVSFTFLHQINEMMRIYHVPFKFVSASDALNTVPQSNDSRIGNTILSIA